MQRGYFIILLLFLFNIANLSASKPVVPEKVINSRAGFLAGGVYTSPNSGFGGVAKIYYEIQNFSSIGYGLSAEFVVGQYFEFLIGIPVSYYPIDRLKTYGTFGVAFTQSIKYSKDTPPSFIDDLTDSQLNETTGNFFFGIGGGWEIDLSEKKDPKWVMLPTLELNLINLENIYIVLGLNFEMNILHQR